MHEDFELFVSSKIVKAIPEAKLINGERTLGYKVVYPDGYESWCPKDTFETYYRKMQDEEIELIASEQK